MVLGVDLGASAAKLAALNGDRLVCRAYLANSPQSHEAVIEDILKRHGFRPAVLALTAVGAACLCKDDKK